MLTPETCTFLGREPIHILGGVGRAPVRRQMRYSPVMKVPSAIAVLALATLLGLAFGRTAAAQPACLSPAAIADTDVARLAADLSDGALCLGERTVEENGIVWHLVVVRNLAMPGPLWVVPHDEEDEGFDGGVYAVSRYGGTMVAIENGEQRMVGDLDPNRAFAVTAEAAEVCGVQPAPLYVAAILEAWDGTQPIIGLHSNWDGFAGGGGVGTISVRRPDEKMIPFPSQVATGRFADEDTIVMLVGAEPPAANPQGQDAITWLNGHGVHVIYRHVTPENYECTLADYLTLNGRGVYLNLEVERGDAATMPALIDKAAEYLVSPAYRGRAQ
ncbi:MAG: hypothetical protein KIT43_09365 [Bauldia sp.]|nr:hypothetical protein [Bauldia sp.]MCW5717581.1 hypothetical protein [Bauldia sp.]